MPQKNLVELAREGNPEAIATLLNGNLQKHNITAKVDLQGQHLKVLFESDQVPSQRKMYTFMRKGMENLKSEVITKVNLYGKAFDQELYEWEEYFLINQPVEDQFNSGEEVAGMIRNIAKNRKVLTPEERVESYKKILENAGNFFPVGVYAVGFSVNTFARKLAKEINSNEVLIDSVGVRHIGISAYLILTDQRIMCLLPLKKMFEVDLKSIQYIDIGENGLKIKILDESLKENEFYYIESSNPENFKISLSHTFVKLKNVDKISVSTKEDSAIFRDKIKDRVLTVVGVLAITGLFVACISIFGGQSPSSSPSSAEIESCLRRYITGETVSEAEIQAAYENCR
jgi:hypothetical protein